MSRMTVSDRFIATVASTRHDQRRRKVVGTLHNDLVDVPRQLSDELSFQSHGSLANKPEDDCDTSTAQHAR